MKKHSLWLILSLAIAVLCSLFAYAAVQEGESGIGISSATPAPVRPDPAHIPDWPSTGGSTKTNTNPTSTSSPLPSSSVDGVLRCRYFVQKDFMSSVSAAGKQEGKGSRHDIYGHGSGPVDPSAPSASGESILAGGIVPHHLLAGNMIAGFFQTLSGSNPDIIVLVAPNHKRVGHSGLNTSLLDWSTDFGTLKTARETENRILSGLSASRNNSLMEEEHSISSLVPYIKYYMPQVEIVPLLLHGNYTADESSELGRRLAEECSKSGGKRIAIVASVDFSHYLDVETANRMDEQTLTAIRSFDWKAINRMGNDNLDSPPSILTLLSAMQQIGADTVEVTGHGNSSDITGKGADYTTSYYTIFFKLRTR